MASATRTTLLGTAACAVITAGMLAGPGVAIAAPRPVAGPSSGILHHTIPADSAAAAAAAWTPARMHAATTNRFVDEDPADGDPPATATDTSAALDTSAVVAPGAVADLDETTAVPGFAAADHLGVVFFRSGGVDQRCTGNAVVSRSGDLVATSGRCVSALEDAFVSELVFVPGYDGTAPEGVWAATAVTVQSRWVTDRAVDFDSAFFQVQAPAGAAAGATLSSTVGASGVLFAGQEDDDEYRASGYALDGGHDGTRVVDVVGTVEPNPWANKDYAIEGIGTELRAGISGSPWRATEDGSGDVQRGMTTFAYHRFTHVAFGPQWTSTLHDTYRAAAAS